MTQETTAPTLDTVTCADAYEYLRQVAPASVDLCFTSPPYPGVKFWDDMDAALGLMALTSNTMRNVCPTIKPGGYLCVNYGEVPSSNKGFISLRDPIFEGIRAHNHYADPDDHFVQRAEIIWSKYVCNPMPWPCFMRRPCVPHLTHEHILVFVRGKWKPREKAINLTPEEKVWLTQSVWPIHAVKGPLRKLTLPFPAALAERIIRLFSLPGETVLDPFMGAGTTASVAKQYGRHFLGCDISQACVDHANAWVARTPEVQL